MKFNDLTGRTFDHLTVIARAESHRQPNGRLVTMYLCQCDCEDNKQVVVSMKNLVHGHTASCGCVRRKKEQMIKPSDKAYTRCLYVTHVDCFDMTKCAGCGWNPKNNELRKQRIERAKERMGKNEQDDTADAHS